MLSNKQLYDMGYSWEEIADMHKEEASGMELKRLANQPEPQMNEVALQAKRDVEIEEQDRIRESPRLLEQPHKVFSEVTPMEQESVERRITGMVSAEFPSHDAVPLEPTQTREDRVPVIKDRMIEIRKQMAGTPSYWDEDEEYFRLDAELNHWQQQKIRHDLDDRRR